MLLLVLGRSGGMRRRIAPAFRLVLWLLPALVVAIGPALGGTAAHADETFSGVPLRLVVPAIGVDARVQAFDLNPDLTMPAPGDAVTVGWYSFGAEAGAAGNVVLAGHRDWGGRRGAFFALGAVPDGAEIWLQDRRGVWYLYAVQWSVSIPEQDAPIPELLGATVTPVLTLITCSGVFSRAAGQYLERRVVRARLVVVIPPDDSLPASDGV